MKDYTKKILASGDNKTLAANITPGDVILLTNDRLFIVDDVDLFFLNERVAKKYPEPHDEPLPHEVKIDFYNASDDKIKNIRGDTPIKLLEVLSSGYPFG